MKPAIISLLLLAFGLNMGPAIGDTLSDTVSATGELEFYPWSDASEFVRVPRRFLAQQDEALAVRNSLKHSAGSEAADPFVAIPKPMLAGLRFPGLTLDDELSPDSVVWFGLTKAERESVQALYGEIKDRFEKIERTYFLRIDPQKDSFVLKPFSDKAADMKREWFDRLTKIVGHQRAELLDQAIRRRILPNHVPKRGEPYFTHDQIRIRERGAVWLQRGDSETRLDVAPSGMDRQGRQMHQFKFQDRNGSGGTITAPADQIPERWRHLLTPDIFHPPKAL